MTRATDIQTAIRDLVAAAEPRMIALRRDIHAHPELSFEEVRTAGVVAGELERLGIPHRTGVGRLGVVGLIEGGRPGPVLAMRADMDALPILERTGLEFASRNAGKMHACGHDVHTATLLGVAAVLRDLAPRLSGSVKLIFQPAEEGLGGMEAMLADGVLESPPVDMAIGFHNYPGMPVGSFGYVHGASQAASDQFEIEVRGVSGHAAHPDSAVDPIAAAASLILQLQTVVSREVNPIHPAVVTVAAIHAGEAFNTIPDLCVLRGTIRTLRADTRAVAHAAIRRLCAGIEAGMRVSCDVSFSEGTPPLVNDARVLEASVAAVRAQLGDVIAEGEPSLGGEDFALMAERVPAFQLRIGSGQPGRSDSLHNSGYQPDERCIGLGAQALARAAAELLA
jgi:amidohydrolase